MSYDPSRDTYSGHTVPPDGPASDWYPLEAAHVGQPDLPAYGRAFEVRFSGAFDRIGLCAAAQNDAGAGTAVRVILENHLGPT